KLYSEIGFQLIDVYQAWCGPCKAVQNLFRKLKIDFSEDNLLHFASAEADSIETLKSFRKSCEPVFLFSVHGKILSMVKGVNAPLITKIVTDLVQEERKIAAGEKERAEVLTNQILMHICVFLLHLHCFSKYSVEDASRQLAFFFPNYRASEAEHHTERTLAIIRPSLLKERRESVLQTIKDDGFKIAMQKEIILSEEQVRLFYKEHVGQDYFPVLLEQMTSGPTLVLALTRENAVSHWRGLLGPKILEEAKENPKSLRARYSIENIPINQLHGSSSLRDAQKELKFFFPEEQTFALIKPEAVKTHKDEIIQKVKEAGFSISKVKEEALTREMAAQFYKDHEGKPFFEDLVNCMTQGPSVIMVLSKENAVEEWRKLMGPTDPEEAKRTCPESIRAQFAHDILSNAVHGSSNIEAAARSLLVPSEF
uniref:NME/NM23 family member 8 n=1 Tax=Cyanoderma ruficeps TaxID=181631 RepID=A0A8C3QMG7_9PASS